jgi:DnaJ family protein A protein 5
VRPGPRPLYASLCTPVDLPSLVALLTPVNRSDKNPTRLEESTLYFAKLQEAYETLSDPQERAYYDRRRQTAALRGSDGGGDAYGSGDVDDVLSGKKAYGGRPTRRARGLGVRELERFFDKGVWRKGGLADGPGVSCASSH